MSLCYDVTNMRNEKSNLAPPHFFLTFARGRDQEQNLEGAKFFFKMCTMCFTGSRKNGRNHILGGQSFTRVSS